MTARRNWCLTNLIGYDIFTSRKRSRTHRKRTNMLNTTYTEVKQINKNNKVYAEMAIEKLCETCDWVTPTDGNILILKNGSDFVAIPDIYEGEGTEFWTTLDVMVVLTSNRKGQYIAEVAE